MKSRSTPSVWPPSTSRRGVPLWRKCTVLRTTTRSCGSSSSFSKSTRWAEGQGTCTLLYAHVQFFDVGLVFYRRRLVWIRGFAVLSWWIKKYTSLSHSTCTWKNLLFKCSGPQVLPLVKQLKISNFSRTPRSSALRPEIFGIFAIVVLTVCRHSTQCCWHFDILHPLMKVDQLPSVGSAEASFKVLSNHLARCLYCFVDGVVTITWDPTRPVSKILTSKKSALKLGVDVKFFTCLSFRKISSFSFHLCLLLCCLWNKLEITAGKFLMSALGGFAHFRHHRHRRWSLRLVGVNPQRYLWLVATTRPRTSSMPACWSQSTPFDRIMMSKVSFSWR